MNREAGITTTPTPEPRRAKTVSGRQLAANRANARKSTGPRTPQGKRISCYNNLQHGLTAVSVCFPSEDPAQYEAERAEYYGLIQPANVLERAVLDDLVASGWQMKRAVRTENGCVREQIVRKRAEVETTFDALSPHVELSLGIRSLGDESKFLDRSCRHQSRLHRRFYTAIRMLISLRRDPPFPAVQPQSEIWQHEPIPEIVHSPEPAPIGNAAAPNIIVLAPKKSQDEPIPKTGHPQQRVMTACAAAELPTGHNPQLTRSPAPLTTTRELTTGHCRSITSPLELTTTSKLTTSSGSLTTGDELTTDRHHHQLTGASPALATTPALTTDQNPRLTTFSDSLTTDYQPLTAPSAHA